MYKTIEEAISFVKELAPLIEKAECSVYLAVPYTAIKPTVDAAQGTPIVIGAQNMNDATEGSFTGEIAAKMLIDAGAKFVILGHSERRRLFQESNQLIQKKVRKALDEGLQPLVCVGENQEEREAGQAHEIVKQQIRESLEGVSTEEISGMILAYEPVWAIGTGLTASTQDAEEMIAFCRSCIAEMWSKKAADQVIIQYGGSVKQNNAQKLMEQPDIDGLLVGGASLKVESFSEIVSHSLKHEING